MNFVKLLPNPTNFIKMLENSTNFIKLFANFTNLVRCFSTFTYSVKLFAASTNFVKGCIVCRGVRTTPFINKPPIIGYLPIFRILLTPPPPPPQLCNISAFLYLYPNTSICIKPCYEHIMKAVKEWWF